MTPNDLDLPPDLAALTRDFLAAKGRALAPGGQATLRAYRQDLDRFATAMAGMHPKAISPLAIERFLGAVATRSGRPLAPATVNRLLASLRGLFSWAAGCGLLDRDPSSGVKKTRLPEPEAKALGPEIRQQLLSRARRAGPRHQALIEFIIGSGLRAAEALSVNVGDLDLKSGAVNLRRGKGGRGRIVYLTEMAKRALMRYLRQRGPIAPDAPLFVTPRGRLSYPQADRLLKGVAADLKNPDGSPLRLHQLRHEFATVQLARGMNPYHLARITGHHDLRMLDRYTKASRDAAAEAEFRSKNR